MDRRQFLKTVATSAIGIAAGSCAFADNQKAKTPNIIFILVDDLGYGDLGCFGQKQIKTPDIDKMAAEGMRFTNHYAGSTVCAPSRCSLMTGKHTGHCRIRGNSRLPVKAEDVTVAEVLKTAGYKTALIGKWGLGEEGSAGIPNKKGFDYFFGYLNQRHAHNYYTDYLWRNTEKVKLKNEVVYKDKFGSAATKRVEYSNDLMTDEALSFVEKNKDDKFFLYLAYTIPHANNESGLVNKHGMEVPDLGIYKDRDWPAPQKGYAAMITRMDGYVGKLLDKLKKLGIDDDTVVFFTSDNGPHAEGGAKPNFFNSRGPLRGIKRSLHDGGIRVPMIVRWPGKIKAGSVSDLPGAFWDFMPTAAELASVSAPDDTDGISFVAALTGKDQKQKKHEFLYWEFHEGGFFQAVRYGQYKALRKGLEGKIRLYDLEKDIHEDNDIAESRPAVVEKIKQYLKNARTYSEYFKAKK